MQNVVIPALYTNVSMAERGLYSDYAHFGARQVYSCTSLHFHFSKDFQQNVFYSKVYGCMQALINIKLVVIFPNRSNLIIN